MPLQSAKEGWRQQLWRIFTYGSRSGMNPYLCGQNTLSPSPQPSPPGRGSSVRQSYDNLSTVIREDAVEWFTLSLGERAGVGDPLDQLYTYG